MIDKKRFQEALQTLVNLSYCLEPGIYGVAIEEYVNSLEANISALTKEKNQLLTKALRAPTQTMEKDDH